MAVSGICSGLDLCRGVSSQVVGGLRNTKYRLLALPAKPNEWSSSKATKGEAMRKMQKTQTQKIAKKNFDRDNDGEFSATTHLPGRCEEIVSFELN